jgi:CRP-like cAMP-binding protein
MATINSCEDIFSTIRLTLPDLTLAHGRELSKIGHIKVLSKKEFLIKEGDVCDFIAVVIKGTLRSFLTNDKDELNNDFYLEGDIASAYTSFLTAAPTNCNIQALDKVTLLMISRHQFDYLMNADIIWLKLGKYISDTYFKKKCKRETSFLKLTAKERYESVLKTYPHIEQRVSQYHIASFLGIKPESLSRIKLLTYINR